MAAGQELETTRARELAALEARIEGAFRSAFTEAGQALEDIRDAGLYRLRYKSFPAYLAGRWEISESYATRLIQAARVWRSLSLAIGKGNVPLPAVESHVRALMAAPPDRRAEVWRGVLASTGGHPTARKISEAARQARPEPEAPRPEPRPEPEAPRKTEPVNPFPEVPGKTEPRPQAARPEPEVPRRAEPVSPPVTTTTDITTYERLRAEFASALKAKDAEITELKRQLGVRTPQGMPECMWCGGTGIEPAPLPRRTA